jgi:hypothetical protein
MGKLNLMQKDLEAMRFAQLADLREKYKDDPEIQAQLAPYEHQQFARGLSEEDPLNALGLAIATPGYALAKSPALIRLSQMLGLVGPGATPASLDQIRQAYKGIGQGLTNTNWRNTGKSLRNLWE